MTDLDAMSDTLNKQFVAVGYMYSILKYNELWRDAENHPEEGEYGYDYACVGRKFSVREFPEMHKEYYNRLKQTMLKRIGITFDPEVDPLTGGRFWSRTYLTGEKMTQLYETIDYSNPEKEELDLMKMVIPNSYFKENKGKLTVKEGSTVMNFHSDLLWDKEKEEVKKEI